jgi:hypothetical protein
MGSLPVRFGLSLYFLAFTDEAPPEPLDSPANRAWLWTCEFTQLELQHWHGFEPAEELLLPPAGAALGFAGYDVLCTDVAATADRLCGAHGGRLAAPAGACLPDAPGPAWASSATVLDPDGRPVRLVARLSTAGAQAQIDTCRHAAAVVAAEAGCPSEPAPPGRSPSGAPLSLPPGPTSPCGPPPGPPPDSAVAFKAAQAEGVSDSASENTATPLRGELARHLAACTQQSAWAAANADWLRNVVFAVHAQRIGGDEQQAEQAQQAHQPSIPALALPAALLSRATLESEPVPEPALEPAPEPRYGK